MNLEPGRPAVSTPPIPGEVGEAGESGVRLEYFLGRLTFIFSATRSSWRGCNFQILTYSAFIITKIYFAIFLI